MRLVSLLALALATPALAQPRFDISWPTPHDGHVILIIAAGASNAEPRNGVNEGLGTNQIFGADVDNARTAAIGRATLGYPRAALAQIPAGDYTVQAVLNIYETFHRSDGQLP